MAFPNAGSVLLICTNQPSSFADSFWCQVWWTHISMHHNTGTLALDPTFPWWNGCKSTPFHLKCALRALRTLRNTTPRYELIACYRTRFYSNTFPMPRGPRNGMQFRIVLSGCSSNAEEWHDHGSVLCNHSHWCKPWTVRHSRYYHRACAIWTLISWSPYYVWNSLEKNVPYISMQENKNVIHCKSLYLAASVFKCCHAEKLGQRAFVGKVNMDTSLHEQYKETTENSIRDTKR